MSGSTPTSPQEVTAQHWLWSHRHPAPARFRRSDYGDGSRRPLGGCVRDLIADRARHPSLRRDPNAHPGAAMGMALQSDHGVPGLGRRSRRSRGDRARGHQHAVAGAPPLRRCAAPDVARRRHTRYRARIAKVLHVSPFLDEQYEYVIEVARRSAGATYPSRDRRRSSGHRTRPCSRPRSRSTRDR